MTSKTTIIVAKLKVATFPSRFPKMMEALISNKIINQGGFDFDFKQHIVNLAREPRVQPVLSAKGECDVLGLAGWTRGTTGSFKLDAWGLSNKHPPFF